MSFTLSPADVLRVWNKGTPNADAPVRFERVSPIRAAIAAGTYAEPTLAGEPLARVAADIGHPDLAAYIRDGMERAKAVAERLARQQERERAEWDRLNDCDRYE